MDLNKKLEILAGAAKYDVSCSSSGSTRKSSKNNLGSVSKSGICHSFTPDGRCISLLKILLTNCCIYDCSYCINRRSNDVLRATFTPDEIINLTINFYRRNYIEGLFLSSAIIKDANYTMELLLQVVKKLRIEYNFGGYIHLKAIPGADEALIREAGLYADRMSVNIELPSSSSLKLLAPEKNKDDILKPMALIRNNIIANKYEKSHYRHSNNFVPAGQSTQLIVGATNDNDLNILTLSENLYNRFNLKRVYYSAYTPVNTGGNLPNIKNPPTLREHRLYQGDWLLRVYGFKSSELLNADNPNFDINFDPKTTYALNNFDLFPVEINKAPYDMLIRIPGIGIKGAQKIISSRRLCNLNFSDLKKLGIVLKRAQYFITCNGKYHGAVEFDDCKIKRALTPKFDLNLVDEDIEQLSFFDNTPINLMNNNLMKFNKRYLLSDNSSSITGEI